MVQLAEKALWSFLKYCFLFMLCYVGAIPIRNCAIGFGLSEFFYVGSKAFKANFANSGYWGSLLSFYINSTFLMLVILNVHKWKCAVPHLIHSFNIPSSLHVNFSLLIYGNICQGWLMTTMLWIGNPRSSTTFRMSKCQSMK